MPMQFVRVSRTGLLLREPPLVAVRRACDRPERPRLTISTKRAGVSHGCALEGTMTLVFSSKTYFFNVEVAAIAAIVLNVALIGEKKYKKKKKKKKKE